MKNESNLKHEIRRTNARYKAEMTETRVSGLLSFGALNLFRISCFEFSDLVPCFDLRIFSSLASLLQAA